VIDYLIDHLDEPERIARPTGVTVYMFHPDGGSVRVTADAPSVAGGLSAWWVHAETEDRLADLARLLLPWGTLGETLTSATRAGKSVLEQVKSASP
jgi:hypothetical protein